MVHLLIINVRIPPNASFFFSSLLSFVTFNIVQLEPYLRKAFKIDASYDEVLFGGTNFDALGYPSNYFAINIGNLALALCYFIAAYLFHLVTLKATNRKVLDIRSKVTGHLFWNEPIQFLTETYMILTISTFTNFFVFKFDSFGKVISSSMTVIAFIVMIGLPIIATAVLLKNKENLRKEDFFHKWRYLYETLNFKRRGVAVLYEPLLFYSRILILAAALLFLQRLRSFQIIIAVWLTVAMFIYVGLVEPYTDKNKTFFEQFNEFCILVIVYFLMCFADTVPDAAAQNQIGLMLIAFVILNLLINIGYVMYLAIKDAYVKLRLKYYNWKLAKLRSRHEARRKKGIFLSLQEQVVEPDFERSPINQLLESGMSPRSVVEKLSLE
jgi:hypothetical protein